MLRKTLSAASVLVCLAGAAFAQGLGGPSSVQADLQPGDGLTDPQFRSDFPVNIALAISDGRKAWPRMASASILTTCH